jgi:hypothetical protein
MRRRPGYTGRIKSAMQNLGSGGEARGSAADREAADTDAPRPAADENVDQTGRGDTMDTALGANADPIGSMSPQVGQGETVAYGETAENAPAPTAPADGTETHG